MKEFDPPDNSASIVSVTDRVRTLTLGMPVTAVHFLGDNAAFVGAEESVAVVGGDGEISRSRSTAAASCARPSTDPARDGRR